MGSSGESTSIDSQFSLDEFRRIITEVQSSGYQFFRLDDSIPNDRSGRCFFLRHDVDISPRCALRLGRIAAGQRVVSNFLFQLNAETYNLFSPFNLGVIRELRELGHCVGLHIDEELVGLEPEKIRLTLRWFSEVCTPVDPVVSFHRPTPASIGLDFDGFYSGYGSQVFSVDRYLSDSRRSWGFRDRLKEWLAAGRTPIQLLLHPEWWSPHGTAEEIWNDLRQRCDDELARYMVSNFKKVFGDVIAVRDDREFDV